MRPQFIAGYLVDNTKSQEPLYLLLKRQDSVYLPGIWQIVTGKVEEHETVSCAIKREVLEETGYIVDCVYNVDITMFYDQTKDQIAFSANFCCLVDSKKSVNISLKEHSDYQWCSFNEAKNLLAFPSQKETLKFIHQNYILNQPNPVNKLNFK